MDGKWYGPGGANTTATAEAAHVKAGQTFYGSSSLIQTGEMPLVTPESAVLTALTDVYVPDEGYHDGTGTVKSGVLPVQAFASGSQLSASGAVTVTDLSFKPYAVFLVSDVSTKDNNLFALRDPDGGDSQTAEAYGPSGTSSISVIYNTLTVTWTDTGFTISHHRSGETTFLWYAWGVVA